MALAPCVNAMRSWGIVVLGVSFLRLPACLPRPILLLDLCSKLLAFPDPVQPAAFVREVDHQDAFFVRVSFDLSLRLCPVLFLAPCSGPGPPDSTSSPSSQLRRFESSVQRLGGCARMPIRVREVGLTKPPTAQATVPRGEKQARLIPRGNTLAWCRSFFALPFAHWDAFWATASTFAERYSRRSLAVKLATHPVAPKALFSRRKSAFPPSLSATRRKQ